MTASTSLMVPKEHLSRVQGFNQMLNGGMNIASAPLGALLLGVLPMQGVLAIDIVTALIAILPLLFIAVPQPERRTSALEEQSGAKPSVWQDLQAGLRYVWAWPGLVLILLMATLINLVLNPAFALLPILVTKYFGGQALQLAWTESGWGLGVVLGGLLLGVWGGFRRRIYTSLLGLVGIGIGSLAISLLPPGAMPLAIAFMFLLGITNPIVNGPLFAVLQDVVAPEMQGRVFTLIASVAAAMTPLGLIIAGPVADKFGAQSWFLIGGVITLLMGIVSAFIPAITHLEDGRTAAQPVEAEKAALSPLTGD
jgi:DHA3 family macrolide efflux protein-like MFS transporter